MLIDLEDEDVIDTLCEITSKIVRYLSLESKVNLAKRIRPKLLEDNVLCDVTERNIERIIDNAAWYGIWSIINEVIERRWAKKLQPR